VLDMSGRIGVAAAPLCCVVLVVVVGVLGTTGAVLAGCATGARSLKRGSTGKTAVPFEMCFASACAVEEVAGGQAAVPGPCSVEGT
jgi:hypothetical protein